MQERADHEVEFSPGGTYLTITSSLGFDVWDREAEELVVTVEDRSISNIAISPDEDFLVYQRGESVEMMTLPDGDVIWQMSFDESIFSPVFESNTVVSIISVWGLEDGSGCYAVSTGRPVDVCPDQTKPLLETDTLQFFGDGRVADTSGDELTRMDLPEDAVSMVLSNDETRLWVEYMDGTWGLWAVNHAE